jgi:ribosomal protein L7/L12
MLLAGLDATDLLLFSVVILVCSGGGVAANSFWRAAERERWQRVEQKLDHLLAHLGVPPLPVNNEVWQTLAGDPQQKIAAIKAYRTAHGVGLADAKHAVEAYIRTGATPTPK